MNLSDFGIFCVATWLGCGDDDSNAGGGDKADMVGTWRIVDDASNVQQPEALMRINANGTWNSAFAIDFSISDVPAQSYNNSVEGTCTRSGNKVTAEPLQSLLTHQTHPFRIQETPAFLTLPQLVLKITTLSWFSLAPPIPEESRWPDSRGLSKGLLEVSFRLAVSV